MKLGIFCIFYMQVFESFESYARVSHVTLPLGGKVGPQGTSPAFAENTQKQQKFP